MEIMTGGGKNPLQSMVKKESLKLSLERFFGGTGGTGLPQRLRQTVPQPRGPGMHAAATLKGPGSETPQTQLIPAEIIGCSRNGSCS